MKLPDIEKVLGTPRAEAAFLGFSFILAFIYRAYGAITSLVNGVPELSHVSYDGVFYLQIARNILAGDGLGWEAMLFPVLQPVLIVILSVATGIKNLAFLSSFVSQISGAALLIPVYFLAKELYGRRAAFVAVLVVMPYPHLVAISGADTAESLYTAFVFLSLFLGYRALTGASRRYLFATGVSMGFTYLARPEGFFVFSSFFVLAAWRLNGMVRRREALKGLGLLTAGFMLLSLPYVAFLTRSYGRVVFSPKLPYESVVMKAKVLNEPLRQDEVEGLTENGEIAWREKGGAGLVLKYFMNDPGKFTRIYMANLASELPWEVRNSTHLEGYPIVYPVYIWGLALLGFGLLMRRPDARWKAVLLWCPFFNLFIYPVFTKGFWIYHAPYAPALVILAIGGVIFAAGRMERGIGRPVPLLVVLALLWGGYSTYVKFSSKPQQSEVINFRTMMSDESRRVGELCRANFGTKVTYEMEWSRLVYYLGGRWVSLPCSDPERAVDYGRRNGADYLVEEITDGRNDQSSIYRYSPSLEKAYEFDAERAPYSVIVWRIRK